MGQVEYEPVKSHLQPPKIKMYNKKNMKNLIWGCPSFFASPGSRKYKEKVHLLMHSRILKQGGGVGASFTSHSTFNQHSASLQ